MRITNLSCMALVAGAVGTMACSSAAPPTIIIMNEVPAAPDAGAAARPPVTFAGNGGATNTPPPAGTGTTPTPGAGGIIGTPPIGNGGATSGAAGASSDPGASAGSGVPCDVATYLSMACLSCHNDPPIPSALAALVTYDQLMATAKEDPTKNEAELSLARMKDASRPMPPGAPPSASDVAILENWINAGYPKGSCGGAGAGDSGTGGPPPPPPPPPASVFDGAPAFALVTGSRAHNAGQDCMHCHTQANGEAPQLSFGGTLYDGAGNPVAGAEVRLVDANNNATVVHTGSNGTFYRMGGPIAAPAHVGARDASNSADMISALASNGGACSSCHCTGTGCTVSQIHLP